MKASELIEKLQTVMQDSGKDPEVLARTHGCCPHGHDINHLKLGGDEGWQDEAEAIVLDCG